MPDFPDPTFQGATLLVPGDVSISFTTLLPQRITFAGTTEALGGLADNLRRLAATIENEASAAPTLRP